MARPLWFVKILKKTFPHIIIIAKMTRFPIIGKLIEKMLFEGDDIIFLPKDKVMQINKSLEPQDEIILF